MHHLVPVVGAKVREHQEPPPPRRHRSQHRPIDRFRPIKALPVMTILAWLASPPTRFWGISRCLIGSGAAAIAAALRQAAVRRRRARERSKKAPEEPGFAAGRAVREE